MIENTQISQRIAEIQARLATLPRPTATSTSSTGFSSALKDAVGTVGATSASGTGAKLNAEGIPTDLAKYGNGKIPESALASAGVGSHKLWAPAAASFQKMRTDAEKVGVKIGVTDSYRSYDEQVDLAERKGLYSQGGLAAKPGTSDHGWGMSLDLDLNDRAQKWMRENGAQYGFKENVPREAWHWTFTPK